ncbi:MAG: Hsp20/alpha crystallin family protein [Planctomycetaceae bacterium]|nr:Hsp20/alpha crystallin family protein [Planctomycetaceae bacterium]
MTDKCKPRFPFFEELDKGLSMLVNEVLQGEGDSGTSTSVPLTIYEMEDRFQVECDLPGVSLEDIELKLENGVLEISGRRHRPKLESARVTHEERSYVNFRRRLQLGRDIQPEGVDAELGSGVLRVMIPKSDAVRSQQIPIRPAADER